MMMRKFIIGRIKFLAKAMKELETELDSEPKLRPSRPPKKPFGIFQIIIGSDGTYHIKMPSGSPKSNNGYQNRYCLEKYFVNVTDKIVGHLQDDARKVYEAGEYLSAMSRWFRDRVEGVRRAKMELKRQQSKYYEAIEAEVAMMEFEN